MPALTGVSGARFDRRLRCPPLTGVGDTGAGVGGTGADVGDTVGQGSPVQQGSIGQGSPVHHPGYTTRVHHTSVRLTVHAVTAGVACLGGLPAVGPSPAVGIIYFSLVTGLGVSR